MKIVLSKNGKINFYAGMGLAIVSALFFSLGVFEWHNTATGTVFGLLYIVGLVIMRKDSNLTPKKPDEEIK